MRYEPLISATGASGGSGNGKSGFDRGGYTGYSIRGMESNRVGIDVDGIAQPSATGRGCVGRRRAQHPSVSAAIISTRICTAAWISSPAPPRRKRPTSAIGGMSPSARKSADDYLRLAKTSAFGYRSGYDSADRSWQQRGDRRRRR